jgi:hypothetical protein
MADYAITNVTRRVVYTGSAGVGPYAFSFPVLVNTDIAVYKNSTLLTLTTDYTVTISGTTGQGQRGGNQYGEGGGGAGRGGGGARGSGGDGSTLSGSFGGIGVASTIAGGFPVYRAGGGGGGGSGGGSGGNGGGGRGGRSFNVAADALPGSANTGGGGGGGANINSSQGNGQAGGSGVVILRYPSSYTITIGSGLVGSTDTTSVFGSKITTITQGSGNVSWALA